MNSKYVKLIDFLTKVRLNSDGVSRRHNPGMYEIYAMESFELDLSSIQMMMNVVLFDDSIHSVNGDYHELVKLVNYFTGNPLRSKVTFLVDHYENTDEFIMQGFYIDDPDDLHVAELNQILIDLKGNRYGDLLNGHMRLKPTEGINLFNERFSASAHFNVARAHF